MTFRTSLGETIFKTKYASTPLETWEDRANTIVNYVCGNADGTKNNLMEKTDRDELAKNVREMKFMPGGRYIYYAGRPAKFYNNCYLHKLEDDTREAWANLTQSMMSCLMTGGGVGADISVARPSGRRLNRTGGVASGPLPLMKTINAVGKNVMQGGGRRSAIYMSMNHQHEDADSFLTSKNWHEMMIPGTDITVSDAKKADFNYDAPLDMMNISLNYDDAWLRDKDTDTFMKNCHQAMMTGEPGFSFNFGEKQDETLRNACCEITSSDPHDVCNLGSINLANIDTLDDFKDVVHLASKFLVCGLIRAELPYEEVRKVRQKNSRLGLGLMGLHEWLLQRGHGYEMCDELKQWLKVYRDESERSANEHCDRLFLNQPKGYRAIAPTGSIATLAGTTSGVEPVFSLAYRRRWITEGVKWKYQYMIDGTAQALIEKGIDHTKIETTYDLAKNIEKRIKFQYDLQKYVDHAISSTFNLPPYGTEFNNEDKLEWFASIVKKYAGGLRGLTFYPDGSRGGQPLTPVDYEEAIKKRGIIFEDNSEEQCMSGVCGI